MPIGATAGAGVCAFAPPITRSTATSKGWEKGKLVWMGEGMMGGQKMKNRDTFTEKNPREISYVGEIGTPDGKWAAAWEANCKK